MAQLIYTGFCFSSIWCGEWVTFNSITYLLVQSIHQKFCCQLRIELFECSPLLIPIFFTGQPLPPFAKFRVSIRKRRGVVIEEKNCIECLDRYQELIYLAAISAYHQWLQQLTIYNVVFKEEDHIYNAKMLVMQYFVSGLNIVTMCFRIKTSNVHMMLLFFIRGVSYLMGFAWCCSWPFHNAHWIVYIHAV